ncbi:MAG: FG-GAP-like repeat-containing protein [Myxococcota bacterium]
MASWQIEDSSETTLIYRRSGVAGLSLRAILRVVDPGIAPSAASQIEAVVGQKMHRLRFGSESTGATLVQIVNEPGTIVVPPVVPGRTRTEYILIELQRNRDGSGADLFVNGVEVASDLVGESTTISEFAFGDFDATLGARVRYAVVETSSPACQDFRDNDLDGRIDFSGGDPGCSQPNDPTEGPPVVPCENAPDRDGDLVCDFDEWVTGTSPSAPDSDDDGLLDGSEVRLGTSPTDPDSDDDGLSDSDEPGRRGFSESPIIAGTGSKILVADLDSDGDPDLVSTSQGGLGWQANDGHGHFGSWQAIDASYAPLTLDAADIDGDGFVDLVGSKILYFVGGGRDTEVRWFRNGGATGGFEPRAPIEVFDAEASRGAPVWLVDVDGDRDLDLIVAFDVSGVERGLFVYENADGIGGFAPRRALEDFPVSRLGFGDFDADGRLDIHFGGSIRFGSAAAASGFDPHVSIYPDRTALPSPILAAAPPVAIADIDGDGDLDFANHAGWLMVWHENVDGTGRTWRAHIIGSEGTAPSGSRTPILLTDLDGDGDPDLLALISDYLASYENLDGRGDFGPLRPIASSIHSAPNIAIAVADFDSDGDLDILHEEPAGVVTPLLRTGFDPLDADRDHDGLCDGSSSVLDVCATGEDANGNGVFDPGTETDPNRWDTDGDRAPDGMETAFGSDPLDPFSVPDIDADGVLDPFDNCLTEPNEAGQTGGQLDTDADGFGNRCDADFDQSGRVDGADFGFFVSSFNQANALTDLDGSGSTDGADFGRFISLFNGVPGPSSLSCAAASLRVDQGDVPCRIPSAFETDGDGDGVSDGDEIVAGTDRLCRQLPGCRRRPRTRPARQLPARA